MSCLHETSYKTVLKKLITWETMYKNSGKIGSLTCPGIKESKQSL